MKRYRIGAIVVALLTAMVVSACSFGFDPNAVGGTGSTGGSSGSVPVSGETGVVTHIVDGDTFDVNLNGQVKRVRYIGINTPESYEACYAEATQADSLLIMGKTVTLVKDVSETDIYGRLLRYVYVGSDFINADLVEQGYAEAVLYPPDEAHYDEFVALEKEAAAANRGCHPTGVFDDGSYTR